MPQEISEAGYQTLRDFLVAGAVVVGVDFGNRRQPEAEFLWVVRASLGKGRRLDQQHPVGPVEDVALRVELVAE